MYGSIRHVVVRLAALGGILAAAALPAAAQYHLVDLTPAGYDTFDGGAAVTGAQAGSIGINTASVLWQAAYWNGTTGSMVNLAPGSAPGIPGTYSQDLATDGFQQVGFVVLNNFAMAALWTGTAASWVNLHPAALEMSEATGVSQGQQAGFGIAPPTVIGDDSRVTVYPKGKHALTWQGTAASYQDIHPLNFLTSECWGVENGVQVGDGVDMNGMTKALRWTGTADSATDISPFTEWVGNPAHA